MLRNSFMNSAIGAEAILLVVRLRNIEPGERQDLCVNFYFLRGLDPVPRFFSHFLLFIVVVKTAALYCVDQERTVGSCPSQKILSSSS